MITTPELPLLVFGVLLTDQLYYYYDPYSLLSYKLYKGLSICFLLNYTPRAQYNEAQSQ